MVLAGVANPMPPVSPRPSPVPQASTSEDGLAQAMAMQAAKTMKDFMVDGIVLI